MTPRNERSNVVGSAAAWRPLAAALLASLLLAGPQGARAQLSTSLLYFPGFCWGIFLTAASQGWLACAGDRDLIGTRSLIRAPMVLRRNPQTGAVGQTSLQAGGNSDIGGSGTNQSRAGTCIVGFQDAAGTTPYHAFRWTEAGGAVDLGTLDAANNAVRSSDATATSDDCGVVVGSSQFNGNASAQHAYRWTAAGGMVDLGAAAGASRNSRAFGVSAVGDIVVGETEFVDANAFSGFRTGAYRWTAAGGFQSLGAIEPGFSTSATAVSADGSVVVGSGGVQVRVGNSSTNGSRAFRWSQAGGLVPIGPLPGHTFAQAAGVSDNGKIVVGTSSAGPLDRNGVGGLLRGGGSAFRWTEATGIQDLRQLLVAAGIDMTGITLLNVTAISPDGQWIGGQATTPTTPAGETAGYVVQYCDAAIGSACVDTAAAAPSFALAASASALNVIAGQSGSTTLTITPAGGFNAAVAFACSGLPQGATCSFAPATVTPTGAAAATTLTIATDGGPVALWLRENGGIALALLLPVFLRRRTGERPGARRSAWFAAALIAAWLVACGGGGGGDTGAGDGSGGGGSSGGGSSGGTPPATGTPAGTSTVTVTATSGSGASALSRSVTLTLTVTR